jgi:hypothetical protein
MVFKFDPDRVSANARKASTEDLLDRVTVYRSGMEPQALTIIEEELAQRGVDRRRIQEHGESREREALIHSDGAATMCSFCRKPAVARGWGWHRLWKRVPIFPRLFNYCAEHRPDTKT